MNKGIKIKIILEDDFLLVIDKPAGVIVHEGAGQAGNRGAVQGEIEERTPLLTDWIDKNRPEISQAFQDEKEIYHRPGIVHRLDKDTSGLLIIAKTPPVKQKLQSLFKNRRVIKEYTALVSGKPVPEQGSIVSFISRDPHHRRQMAVSFVGKGKEATTDYRTIKTWYITLKGQVVPVSLVRLTLRSGRMHQVRVHMKHKGWPVVGDQTYQTKQSRDISKTLALERQFLHASRLRFIHPMTNQAIEVTSQLPDDLARTVNLLENHE